MNLFHTDTIAVVRTVELRAAARHEVETSSLIQRCAAGDQLAAIALHKGFWPFVSEFELAIDQHPLPRRPLRAKFGAEFANRIFLGLAKSVRQMKTEEGSHAAPWQKDAESLGVHGLDAPLVDGVRDLIVEAYLPDHVRFFSVLAGTEFIAEELGTFLVNAPRYVSLFGRKRWVWGEVHLNSP